MEETLDDLVGDSFVLVFTLPSKGVVSGCFQKHAELQSNLLSENIQALQAIDESLVIQHCKIANVLCLPAKLSDHPHCSPGQLQPLLLRGRGLDGLSDHHFPHHLHLLHAGVLPPPCPPLAAGESMQQTHHIILEQLINSLPLRPEGDHFQ